MAQPTLSFLIPSLKNDEHLECRVYMPKSLLSTQSALPNSRASTSYSVDSRSFGGSEGQSSPDYVRDSSRRKMAIVAHPYAPLGGHFDDHVVHETVTILLAQGFIVGTFNFRGAGQSKGHTSWSAKPEVADYMAFVGFMAVFISYLDIHPKAPAKDQTGEFGGSHLSPVPSQNPGEGASLDETVSRVAFPRGTIDFPTSQEPKIATADTPIFLMGGYSYGSLITSLLPTLPEILKSFEQPEVQSAAAEIRFRAKELAMDQNTAHKDTLARHLDYLAHHNGSLSSASIRIGYEDDHRRRSRDGHVRLSTDWARKSVDHVRSIRRSMDAISPSRRSKHGKEAECSSIDHHMRDDSLASSQADGGVPDGSKMRPRVLSTKDAELYSDPVYRESQPLPVGTLLPRLHLEFQVAYLLISPIQGMVGGFATMFATTPMSSLIPRIPLFRKHSHNDHPFTEGELKLVHNRTLAIYGSEDGMSNLDKMRKWTKALSIAPGSRFKAIEIKRAQHFWHERGHLDNLKEALQRWTSELVVE